MVWARLASAHHYPSDIFAGAAFALVMSYPVSKYGLWGPRCDSPWRPATGCHRSRRRKQGLANAVRLSAVRHYAARRACGFAERDDFFRTAAEFARPSSAAGAAALASSLRSVWMR